MDDDDNKQNENTGQGNTIFLFFLVSEEDNGFIIGHVERERRIIRICKILNYQVGKYLKIKKNVEGLSVRLQKSLLVVGTLHWVGHLGFMSRCCHYKPHRVV